MPHNKNSMTNSMTKYMASQFPTSNRPSFTHKKSGENFFLPALDSLLELFDVSPLSSFAYKAASTSLPHHAAIFIFSPLGSATLAGRLMLTGLHAAPVSPRSLYQFAVTHTPIIFGRSVKTTPNSSTTRDTT